MVCIHVYICISVCMHARSCASLYPFSSQPAKRQFGHKSVSSDRGNTMVCSVHRSLPSVDLWTTLLNLLLRAAIFAKTSLCSPQKKWRTRGRNTATCRSRCDSIGCQIRYPWKTRPAILCVPLTLYIFYLISKFDRACSRPSLCPALDHHSVPP